MARGIGEGPTELAAFDAALVDAGVADRNLIVLSSVLPPGSSVERVERIADTPAFWGDRLYCVLAFPRTGALVAGARCPDAPVCALVVAAFEAEGWNAGS